MKNLFLYAFLCFSAISSILFAHEKEEHLKNRHTQKETVRNINNDTISVNNMPEHLRNKHDEPEKEEPFVLNPVEEISEHLHNKVIHFPIALTLVAFLFSLLNIHKHNQHTDNVIKILIGISLSMGILAYFTGTTQMLPFAGHAKEWLAFAHRLAGIITLFLIAIWFVALFFEQTKKYSWLIGLGTSISVLITGFLGGVLAH